MPGDFRLGSDPPRARGASGNGFTCPFCGGGRVVPADLDDPTDDRRLELRCESDSCDVEEFVVLATHVASATGDRADVEALRAVDGRGDEAGWGTPPGAAEGARERAFERRKRPARISVESL